MPNFDLSFLVVGRVCKCPSSTRGDEVHLGLAHLLLRFVSAVVVEVAGDDGADLTLRSRELADHRQCLVLWLSPVGRVQPYDDLVADIILELLRNDGLKIVSL